MSPIALLAPLLVIAALPLPPPPPTLQGPRTVIQAARLFDPGTGSLSREMTVVVVGSRIADVLPTSRYRARPEDRRIDLGDATLLPGLIDGHVHLSIGGLPRANAVAILKAGFTTVADLGAVNQRIQVVRDSIAAGVWEGPRLLAAGLWIGIKNGVCEFGGIGIAGGPEAFRDRVRQNVAAGANLIKLCVTGWPAVAWAKPDSAELSPEILAAAVDEAHKAGRIAVAHALSREGVKRSLDAGVDGLVHAAFVDDALARRMRERGVWVVPTLASLTRGDSSAAARALVDAVGRIHRAGVTLVYGTDGGVLPHGQNAAEALALAAAGIPRADILRAATLNAARALGLADSVGTVRAGMVADLVGVPGNPLADLSVLGKPAFVMARGRVVLGGEPGQGPPPAPSPTSEQWREDLRYLARELPKRHKNLFHSVTREEFDRLVAQLDSAIPSLQPHQIVVRMKQITARVGDGHTGVWLPNTFTIFPIALSWFGKELRITAAAPEYQRAIGTRVVAIGGIPIDEVEARVETTFPSAADENEWFVLNTSPPHIVRPEVLQALGIVKDLGPASFELEDDQGRRLTVPIAPISPPPVVNNAFTFTGFQSAASRQPLFRQRPAEAFWYTWLPDSQTVYVSFRSYASLGENARKLFAELDQRPPARLVIDLRQNGGGDFYQGRRHLIEPIKARPALNQKGKLFVIVGRRTFSAAMANAVDFRKQTNATLVGEPIGERPNSYSENDELTLPNSKVVVSYSTRYYQFVENDVPAVLPDVRIDLTWADFRAGRDPILEWILAQPR